MTATANTTLDVAGPADTDTVADIITDAFIDLTIIKFLVPDPQRRRPVSRAWYRLYIAHALGGAGQVVMTSDKSAAAVWFDRTGPVSEPDDYATKLAELAGPDLPRFRELDQQMEAHHPNDPHWHLLFLAVHPDRQSQGLGSRLMSRTHTRLDAEGIPAYLEATGPENARLYRQHGYADMSPPTLAVSDGTELRRMWRGTSTS
ncbi:GNAT family N-acetyltransferase [Actinoplanes sp. CA-131856]